MSSMMMIYRWLMNRNKKWNKKEIIQTETIKDWVDV